VCAPKTALPENYALMLAALQGGGRYQRTTRYPSQAFRCFDADNAGALSPPGFRAALSWGLTANAELARPHTPLTSGQISQLVEGLPLDEQLRIDYNECMAAFDAVDTSHYERTTARK
jgi:hypothetical protein